MKFRLLLPVLFPLSSFAGVELSGRLAVPDTNPPVMLAAVRAFGFPAGSKTGNAFRSWEMEPRGWWKLEGNAGEWSVLFTGPSHFVRPVLLQAKLEDGTKDNHLKASPHFDYACFAEKAWDTKPARAYWQPFVAKSTSVTHVGFKLATDGVDGAGPGHQTLVASIHRCTGDKPEAWPQAGPSMTVPHVDCGGPKSYHYSCGWHSGEVKLEPGQRYAVKLTAEKEGGVFQAFWEKCADDAACIRTAATGETSPAGNRMWMTISGDGDGLLLPCNKRVHKEFGDFAGFTTSWSQSWTAQGQSLAGVMLYTATSGTQPRMEQQRIAVRIHRGGPDGPIVGPEKIAAASANYTGDASWGVLGTVYARDEVKVSPGEHFTAEFTTLETPDSIGDFVNFKKQVNDRKPGFNPYYRHPSDPFPAGEAWKRGAEKVERDLDLQVIEYAVFNQK
ncbi:MAG TPA: hypothetical protein VG796_26415 [Verrucomicrobiales bacterium]|jgi:hypothetical protein|nr:hypothetical protein [Verrucomicrobiales bacterium]